MEKIQLEFSNNTINHYSNYGLHFFFRWPQESIYQHLAYGSAVRYNQIYSRKAPYQPEALLSLLANQEAAEEKLMLVNICQEDVKKVDESAANFKNNTNSIVLWLPNTPKPKTENIAIISFIQMKGIYAPNINWEKIYKEASNQDVDKNLKYTPKYPWLKKLSA